MSPHPTTVFNKKLPNMEHTLILHELVQHCIVDLEMRQESKSKVIGLLKGLNLKNIGAHDYRCPEFLILDQVLHFFDSNADFTDVEHADGVPHLLFQEVTNESGISEMLNYSAHPDYEFISADNDGASTNGHYCYYKLVIREGDHTTDAESEID